MGSGTEAIEDDAELEAIRAQAREIRSRAVTITVVVTLLLLMIP